MKMIHKFIAVIFIMTLGINPVLACTSFRLIADDNTVMVTRSMEFAEPMNSNIIATSRGQDFHISAPNGQAGLSWKAKYNYIFLDGLGLGVPIDGMNEAGLSFEALLFPEEAQYQTVPTGEEKQALSYLQFGDWVLGNFKTVDEVRAALASVYVFSQPLPELQNTIFPVHYSVFDQTGKGIVVEYVNGQLNIHEHMGVMTNSPTYDWHVTNLRNYLQLSPTNPKPVIANGITYTATGQGSGMIGLPGDISPPSRFVKMAVLLNTVIKPKDAMEALNLSQHMINTVDIPKGFVRVAGDNNTATLESTQWVVFKDLTNKKLYYRTYDDLTIQEVNMKTIDFKKSFKVQSLN
ncbi:MAG: choloylglycine hydrolase family protein [Gammaproteobacteria bacterium]|jgi:choloylglycine hydrolase